MLDFEEKALCRKVAGILELSAIRGYDPIRFLHLWMESKTANNLYNWDFNDIAQSKHYLLRSVEIEYDISSDKEENDQYIIDAMYWCGYTLMYLSLESKITPLEVFKTYDVDRILCAYDTLHTVSSGVAVDMIRTDFKLKNITA